jgi:hypothetical protein
MSVDAQRRHNIVGGHYMNRYSLDDYMVKLVAASETPTMWERITKWFTN